MAVTSTERLSSLIKDDEKSTKMFAVKDSTLFELKLHGVWVSVAASKMTRRGMNDVDAILCSSFITVLRTYSRLLDGHASDGAKNLDREPRCMIPIIIRESYLFCTLRRL